MPVVSIGNLTVGGTGKTPCVEYVARFYRDLGRRVAVLSRGYGALAGRNDEALLLEENLPDVPHLQGPDRTALAEIAVEQLGSEVVVLDDGFQHRRLARDLDVVLLDAMEPWGHGHVLPRGLLRERPQGLRRASMVVLTRCDQAGVDRVNEIRGRVQRMAPGIPTAEARHGPCAWLNSAGKSLDPEDLRGRPAVAFCGIGNPEAFRRTLGDLGLEMMDFRIYPDHHSYTRMDVEDLRSWARAQARGGVAVTTQKDLVKLRLAQLGDKELWALRVDLEVGAGRDALDRELRRVLNTGR